MGSGCLPGVLLCVFKVCSVISCRISCQEKDVYKIPVEIQRVPGDDISAYIYFSRKFDDGFPNLFVKDAIGIRNRHVAFLASFHKPSLIFDQISVIYALPRLFISSFTLILPFFPTGTQERVREQTNAA